MGGFRWDSLAFAGARDRFNALAHDADPELYDLVDTWVVHLYDNMPIGDPETTVSSGLLDIMLAPHHRHLARELQLSAIDTPDMLRWCAENLGRTAARYAAAENAARIKINSVWNQLGRDPQTADPGLERDAAPGKYDFGSDFPQLHREGVLGPGPHYGIVEAVDKVLSLSVAVPEGEPRNPATRWIWDHVIAQWRTIAESLARVVAGNWDGVYQAGDIMCAVGLYWDTLAPIGRRAAGTLFRTWDGEASLVAERFFDKVFTLFEQAGPHINRCGDAYKAHAYGAYLVFLDLESTLNEVTDILRTLFSLLDNDPTGPLRMAVVEIEHVVKAFSETAAEIVGKLLMVIKIIEALVGVVMSAATLFADYTNQMRGMHNA